MIDQKYVVFKREEWEAIAADTGTATRNEFLRSAVEDAVVIRRQDVFAPAALEGYANAITVALSMADPSTPQAKRLREIADYFHGQATVAWDTHRKIPD